MNESKRMQELQSLGAEELAEMVMARDELIRDLQDENSRISELKNRFHRELQAAREKIKNRGQELGKMR